MRRSPAHSPDRNDGLPTVGDRGAGVPLTAGEKRRIDFTETTVVHARWCKSAAWRYEVDDWESWYDPTLTVGEHVNMYARASADPREGPTLRHTPRALLGAPPR